MEIISITMVGNESEIIESFIRYNSIFLDKMFFVSTCCIDNTLLIIRNLIKEGYPIELVEEPEISFEQKYMDNKYLKKVAKESGADLIIPLDVDEFLTGEENPRVILERLPLDYIYEVNWENYAMCEADDMKEMFIPKRLLYVKKHYAGNNIPKVIIPARLVLANHIVLETGHHRVNGNRIMVKHIQNMKLAHYPSISREQYLLKIYGHSIKLITWMNRGNNEATHVNQQIKELEAGTDIYKVANGYGLDDAEEIELVKKPMNLKFCGQEALHIKYPELAKVNFIRSLNRIGQLMAVKAYNIELDKRLDADKKNILVFGTGHDSEILMNGLPEGCVNIRAYIDNDIGKKFAMKNRRLIIPPDFIRFFVYDKIILSSSKYYNEMLDQLIDMGIDSEKIAGADYILNLLLEEEEK